MLTIEHLFVSIRAMEWASKMEWGSDTAGDGWDEQPHRPLTPDEARNYRLAAATDDMAPGVELGRLLAEIDLDHLNGHHLVTVMEAFNRQVAHYQAGLYASMAELAYCPEGNALSPSDRQGEMLEFAACSVSAPLRLTRRAADMALGLALDLRWRLPLVGEALRHGLIDLSRARVIVNGTSHLDDPTARQVAETVLERAPQLTTGQIAAWVRRLCIDADPEAAEKRRASALEERRVVAQPNDDDTADLMGINLPSEKVAALMRKINQLARDLKTRGETRTMDQLRADVFLDLLEGNIHPGRGRRSSVDIRIDLATLMGFAERAGEIPGWGPVIADIARQAVEQQPDGEWRVTVTDPDTGNVTWNGTTRRRPTTGQRRHVEARNPTCVWPGCRMPARDCDLDHTYGVAQGGRTEVVNFGPLCRYNHTVKTRGGWRVRHPSPGRWIWTSPHGHTYETFQPP